MNTGTIDTTTVYGIISAFQQEEPKLTDKWAWENLVETTALLSQLTYLKLSQVPKTVGTYQLGLDTTMGCLQYVLRPETEIDNSIKNKSEELTGNWVDANLNLIRNSYSKIKKENKEFKSWLNWHRENSWKEHCSRLGALTDLRLIPLVSKVLEVDQTTIHGINELVLDNTKLNQLIRGQLNETSEAENIYAISVIIRGKYYEVLSEKMSEQYFPHHLRDIFLSKQPGVNYEPSNTEKLIYHLLAVTSYKENGLRNRLTIWLMKLRELCDNKDGFNLSHQNRESVAVDNATEIAIKIGLDPTGKWKEYAIEAALGTSASLFSLSFGLDPYTSIALGGVTSVITNQSGISKKIKHKTVGRKKLRELAKTEPGKITRNWLGSLKINNC